MSTRGICGFRKNNVDKISYNHSDSYPRWLGKKVAKFFADVDLGQLNEVFDSIKMVSGSVVMTEEALKTLPKDLVGGLQRDFYEYLRKAQGDLSWYLNGLKYMIDSNDFIRNSMFCDWGYIINLDTNKLEVWEGSQKTPTDGNRYGDNCNEYGYYPCKLIADFTQEEVKAGEFENYLKEKE